jgi:RHS repeat-associated protein
MRFSSSLAQRRTVHPAFRALAGFLAGIQVFMFTPAPILAAAVAPNNRPSPHEPPPEAFAMQPKAVVPNPHSVPQFSPPSPKLRLSSDPSDSELMIARCFTDPLVPSAGEPRPGENADLAKALLAVHDTPQDLTPLTAFLSRHPDSRWKASLLANLGPIYFQQGYWSKARAALAEAWALSKDATESRLKAIADRDLGDLAIIYARLGDTEHLDALLTEATGRDVQGAGTGPVAAARTSLWFMKNNVGKAFRCGPAAIKRIYQSLYPGENPPKAIGDLKSTAQGTDLAILQDLTQKIGLNFQAAFRSPGAPVIVPAVIHWNTGHFSALIREMDGSYIMQEPDFGLELLLSRQVLDAETSGYCLVPSGALPVGWRPVGTTEAKSIFGKGATTPAGKPPPPCKAVTANDCPPCTGMAAYNFEEASVSLMLMDTPVGYAPPVGPEVKFTANYDHRESASMTNISNLGNKWSFNWLSYLQASGTTATIFGPGGGQLPFTGYNSSTGYFNAQLVGQDLLQKNSATSYTLYHKDGSKEIYDQSDGSATPRIFRTGFIDPFGNAITYAYDENFRLRTVSDALGQTSVINYVSDTPTDAGFYQIAQVTDPFGRYAAFAYNTSGQLLSITDTLGITSFFAYGSGDFVVSLTTPYGTTSFAGNDTVSAGTTTDRWLMATDPAGGRERIEWVYGSPAIGSDPAATVPKKDDNNNSFDGNPYQQWRNTFFWDKNAMVTGEHDYTKAKVIHWLHDYDMSGSTVIESVKEPYENRVWYAYPGQTNTIQVGTSNLPTRVSRILDDGIEQDYKYQYNAAGNATQFIDPLGRETDYVYGNSNDIDLTTIKQKNGAGYDILAAYSYNTHHEPLTTTDASGQVTTYTYNAAGQVRTVKNAKNETTTFWYSPTPTWTGQPTLDPNAAGYLVEIDGAVAGAVARFNYDGFGRVQTVTDSEGYSVTTAYDVFDRPTTVTYPDGTYSQVLYNLLDAEWIRDRLGRWTHQYHDSLRHLAVVVDPLLRRTIYDWCTCGSLSSIMDPAGNSTTWIRDAQGRVTKKFFADGSPLIYAYENTTSRLKSVTDALGQVTKYVYNKDNSVQAVNYTDSNGNALASTPAVSYTYDPVYPRVATMADGTGTTSYTSNPIPASGTTTGAGRLYSIAGPLASSTITYGYDELGRALNTSINGSANTASVVYDALGRIQNAMNPLGTFGYQYVNQTGRVQQITYPNLQVTNYGYYPNSAATPGNGDQRLQQIQNSAAGGANLSTFAYGYNAVGMITSWSKQIDAGAALMSSFAYDDADQLIGALVPNGSSATNYGYAYDLAGNRTSEQIDLGVTGSTNNNLNQLTGQSPGGSMQFTGTVNKWATITVGGKAATVDASGNWRGSTAVTPGANAIPLVATDVNGNTTTKTINITISGGASRTLAYDLDGNLVNDGAGKTYGYDAANRLISITQGSNVTAFVYNGLGQRVQEKLNGTVIKQWVWASGAQPAEERDASNNVTKRFYAQGEQIGGTSYFFTTDHLGSIREMTDSTGAIHARYDYDPYGRSTKVSGDLEADFGFTGFYRHQASGINLALYRAYDANLGRWLSRDPMGESGGINLYGYVGNDPVNAIDPLGLWQFTIGGAIYLGGIVSFGHNSGRWNLDITAGGGIGGMIGLNPNDSGPSNMQGFAMKLGIKGQARVDLGLLGGGYGGGISSENDFCNHYKNKAFVEGSISGKSIEPGYPNFGKIGGEAGFQETGNWAQNTGDMGLYAKSTGFAYSLGGMAFGGVTVGGSW